MNLSTPKIRQLIGRSRYLANVRYNSIGNKIAMSRVSTLLLLGVGVFACSLFLLLRNDATSDTRVIDELEHSRLASGRIRRNLRSLTQPERDRFFTALNTMKTTSTPLGQARYGPGFLSYDNLVMNHMNSTWRSPVRNFTKDGHGFLLYHRLMTWEFEVILNLIDPAIDAIPYWDHDAKGANSYDDTMWSDEWFGGRADGVARMHRFPNWTIARPYNELTKFNKHGFLRFSTGHPFYNDEHLIRITPPYIPHWNHTHCLSFRKFELMHECFMFQHINIHMFVAGFNAELSGDYLDLLAAPNDPVFFVHHANVERLFVAWQTCSHASVGSDTYGYPLLGAQDQGLDDIVTPRTPFYMQSSLDRPVTNRQALTIRLPYAYDVIPPCASDLDI